VSLGVVLAIMASFLTCFGLAIQKTSLCMPGNEEVPPWRQPRWVMGFVSLVAGNIIDFMAFGLAPASLLSPLAALSLVWNLFVSSTILEEKYDRNDIIACSLIFVGTSVTVIFSNHHEHEYTLDKLRELYHMPRMYSYAFLTPCLLALHYLMINAAEKSTDLRWRLCGLIGWCGFAGITGGNSVLFAKSTVELLKDAFHGDDVFLHLDTYLIIAMMILCLLTQIHFLNGAMKRYDQLHVLPVYQSYWIISGVVGGLVYFGEFEELSPAAINMFLIGTAITLSGLYQLTKKENHSLSDAGAQHFDVLPSRRMSEDSYLGYTGNMNDSEDSEEGIELNSHTKFVRRSIPRISSVGSTDTDDARRRSSSKGLVTVMDF